MSVDLAIPGDCSAIRAVAEWLDPGILQPASDAASFLLEVSADSTPSWEGESGAAFRDAVASASAHLATVTDYLRDTASVFRAYANRLDRGREWFREMKDQCVENGLVAVGRQVAVPVSVPFADVDAPDDDRLAYVAYAKKADLYRQLSENVGTWWGELEVWLEENMLSLTLRFDALESLGAFVKTLFADPALVKEGVVQIGEEGLEAALAALRQTASARQGVVDAAMAAAMADNGVARGAVAEARGLARGLEGFDDAIRAVAHGSEILPVIGTGADIALSLYRVAEGDSAITVTLGAAVSAAVAPVAAGAVAAALSTFEIPALGEVVIVGGVVAVVSVAAGQTAEWAYEASVPIDIRETMEAAISGPLPQLDTSSYAVGGS